MGFWNNKEEDTKKEKLETEETEKETEEEESDEETYDMNIECENCGSEETWEIPCGKTVDEFIEDKFCFTI